MLPINDLGSDSPLYFSLLGHPCEHALKHINRTVVTSALRFRGQSRCPETTHRPCASVETGTCTNPSMECCSAKCSSLANESARKWIHMRQSVLQFQIPPNRELANRTAYRRANLRGNTEHNSRALAASLLSPKSSACVVVAVHMLSTSGRHSPITTVLCPAFQMRNSTDGVHFGSVTLWRACSWTAGQVRSTQVRST